MKVQECMSHGACTVRSSDTLTAAARAMWDNDCGALPVVEEDGRVVGMITDRDVCMAAYMSDEPLSAIPVARAMSKYVISCRADDTVRAAEAAMREHQVRRLPVVDEGGHLLGILSINDIAVSAGDGAIFQDRQVTPEEVGLTLAAISRHRIPVEVQV